MCDCWFYYLFTNWHIPHKWNQFLGPKFWVHIRYYFFRNAEHWTWKSFYNNFSLLLFGSIYFSAHQLVTAWYYNVRSIQWKTKQQSNINHHKSPFFHFMHWMNQYWKWPFYESYIFSENPPPPPHYEMILVDSARYLCNLVHPMEYFIASSTTNHKCVSSKKHKIVRSFLDIEYFTTILPLLYCFGEHL